MTPITKAAFIASVLPFFGTVAAHAEIIVCNEFRAPINVAFASDEHGAVTTQGSWRVQPSECKSVNQEFTGTSLYYSANSDGYRDGNATKRYHWGNARTFFVGSRKFKIENADRSRPGTTADGFGTTPLTEKIAEGPYTLKIRFSDGRTQATIEYRTASAASPAPNGPRSACGSVSACTLQQ